VQSSLSPESAPAPAKPSMRSRLSLLLGERRMPVIWLSLLSIVSGFAESALLAIVALLAVSLVPGAHKATHGKSSLFDIHASPGTLLIIAGALTIVRLLLQIPLAIQSSRITTAVLASTRQRMFDAYSRASWSVQSNDREGQLQETLTGQAVQAASAAGQALQVITSSVQFTVLILTALYLNALAAVIVGATSVLLFGLLRPMRARGVRIARALSRANVLYASGIAEANRLTEESHVFGVFDVQRERIHRLIKDSQHHFFRAQLIMKLIANIYQSLIYVFLVAGLAGLYLVGGKHVGALGGVVLLLLRAGTAGQLVQGAYQGLAQSVPFIERTQDAARRYADSAPAEGTTALSSVHAIAFEHVSFAYNAERPVLSDVSFEVAAGESIGIVGPSGAGKSTLVQILLGLRPPGEGQYLINGTPVGGIRSADWHRQVSYVSQEPRLLHASVSENIRFYRDISDEEVQRAARLARIHEDIAGWEKGYDTIIGPRADAVSGGQQQRICLARALAARPEVLVLDEPTSALDPQSEALIGESLLELKSGLTLFIVAHRMSTLDMSDRIMVIVDGRLVGFDTREYLQRENPYYRNASLLAAGNVEH
jgi:ATP-binding cassette subfamily B protein